MISKLRSISTHIAIAGSSILLTYCGAVNLFPVSDDQKLGKQFDQEIRADPKQYPILNNPSARQYVQGIIDRIVRSPAIKYRGTFAYRVELIQDDKMINAFCTPGGYIYVYTGLLKAIDNEATLAGVIGHEIAHAELRHSTERMTTQLGVQTLMEIALGGRPNQNVQLAANAFTGMGLLKNSRSDEEESDEFSFKYLQSTNWYPGGILYFFEKIKGRSGGSLERLFSTHPLPQDRIDQTHARLKKHNIPPATEAQLNMRGYTEFKRTI